MMAHHVFKPKRQKNGKRVISRIWWGQYRLKDDSAYTRFSLKTTDKRVAEKKLEEIVRLEEQRRAGIIAPEPQAQAARASLDDLLKEYVNYLTSSNRSRDYIRKVDQRVGKLIEECGWNRICDISSESFIKWRSAHSSLSAKTLNDYKDAISALLNWLRQSQRITHNPLEFVSKVDGRGRQTFQRRAYTDQEIQRLLSVSGPRAPVYLVAVKTGLRHGEIRQLLWGDVDLDAPFPCVRVRASTTKNRKDAVLPLASDLADTLRALRPSQSSHSTKVFPRLVPNRIRFAQDLKAAQIERWVDGKKVDFHAFRKTFITNLQRAGVHRRVAMELARHSDSRLTDQVYTDESALLTVDAIESLPTYSESKDAHIDAHGLVAGSRNMSRPVAEADPQEQSQVPSYQEERHAFACPVSDCQEMSNQWSRGESNPRPGVVRAMPLRV